MGTLFTLVLMLALYFLPSIIAISRKHASTYAIVFLNLFLGWTCIVWFFLIAKALGNKGASQIVTVNNVYKGD